ncbi:unnamed protein product, partial [marine sediment metagenome]
EEFYTKIHQYQWLNEQEEEIEYLGILVLKGEK